MSNNLKRIRELNARKAGNGAATPGPKEEAAPAGPLDGSKQSLIAAMGAACASNVPFSQCTAACHSTSGISRCVLPAGHLSAHDYGPIIPPPSKPAKPADETGRLPDGSTFVLGYVASEKRWYGSLDVPDVGRFEDSSSAVFKLLRKLDGKYREAVLPQGEQAGKK